MVDKNDGGPKTDQNTQEKNDAVSKTGQIVRQKLCLF